MALTNTTTAAELIEKRISMQVTETLIQESTIIPTVRDFSAMVAGGMDRLDIPLFNELAVQTVSEATGVVAQAIDPTQSQLSLDQHKSVPWSITQRASLQSKLNMIMEAVKNGSKSLAADIDNYLLSIISDGISTAAPDHKLPLTVNPLQDLSNAKKLLDAQNVPRGNRYVAAGPGFVKSLLDDSTIIDASKYGTTNPVQAGFVTNIFGFTVVESNSSSITDDGFFAYHQDICAFARQMGVSFKREEKVLEHREDFAMTQLYGAVAVDGKRGVWYEADGV